MDLNLAKMACLVASTDLIVSPTFFFPSKAMAVPPSTASAQVSGASEGQGCGSQHEFRR